MLLNVFIFSASFANPLSPLQYPGCGCTGTMCKSSRRAKPLSDGDRSPQGSLRPCPGVPAVTSAGVAAPFGVDIAGDRGSAPRPPCCFGVAHPTQHISPTGPALVFRHEQTLKHEQTAWELTDNFSSHLCHMTTSMFVLLSFLPSDYSLQLTDT